MQDSRKRLFNHNPPRSRLLFLPDNSHYQPQGAAPDKYWQPICCSPFPCAPGSRQSHPDGLLKGQLLTRSPCSNCLWLSPLSDSSRPCCCQLPLRKRKKPIAHSASLICTNSMSRCTDT